MKRKLHLMPEILPDPTLRATEGGPRDRATRTMNRLLALATATASVSTQTACATPPGDSSNTTSQVPVPSISSPTAAKTTNSSPNSSSTTSIASTDPTTPSSSQPTTSSTAVPTFVPTPGYGVVDPLPAPVRCPGVAATVKATAKWTQSNGALVVELRLPPPTMTGAFYDTATPMASGGKLVDSRAIGNALVLLLAPTSGAGYITASIPVTCPQGNSHLRATMTLSGARTPGSAVQVSLGDSW